MPTRDDREPDSGQPRAGAPARGPLHGRWALILFFVLALLNALALLSHDPRDTAYLDGGVGGPFVFSNLIGYAGAVVSAWLFLLFGFGAYVLALLLLVMLGRRLVAAHRLRPVGWDYAVGLGLTALGTSMLLGIWPGAGASLAKALNLAETPGGVLGQRLCGPGSGWMRIILNPTGSGIVAGLLLVVGAMVIWVYDWHDAVKAWYVRQQAARAAARAAAAAAEPTRATVRRPAREPAPEEEDTAAGRTQREPELPLPEPASRPERPAAVVKPVAAASGPEETGKAKAGASVYRAAKDYRLPSLELLAEAKGDETTVDTQEVESKTRTLQETLDSFGIEATVEGATSGPRVTLFEVLPAPGVKVERISQISNNIAMELRAISLRILAPIPGRKSVGIEVPNASPAMVSLRSLLDSPAWKNTKASIPLLLGRSISGKVVILDLAQAPHLLIAGATGSGKSVCINTLIMSLLYRFSPEEMRLIMVDPKVVEFRPYYALPHLVVPVVSDVKKVPLALRWAIKEMEHRYQVLAKVGARNLESFNARPKSPTPILDDQGKAIPDRLPFIVLIIDELADIMMTAKADVETSLARIAQLSRAVGIHTVIATQRPSVNVITGTIKANFPTRIAFQVTSQVDSRTILDVKGAESLLGRGDMLFKPPGASKLERNQGSFVHDDEIERVVSFVSAQAEQQFDMDVFKTVEGGGEDGLPAGEEPLGEADEELIQKAIEIILRDRRPTTSYIQRCLRIGYNRAALIIEILEQRGVIGPQIGTAPREILVAAPGGSDATPGEPDVDEVPGADPDADRA